MAATIGTVRIGCPHPFHAVMLAGTVPLFLGALLSDIAYWSSHQVQWTNFASWLIAGGLVYGAIALVCAVVGATRARHRRWSPWLYPGVLLLAWLLAFWNALVHAGDAWASMPAGLVLSAIVAVLVCVATWLAFAGYRQGGAS